MVTLYVTIFKTGSDKALLKFLVLLKKIIKGQNLATLYQWYVMADNLLIGYNPCAFEHKCRATGNKTMTK